jgi:FtsH-binding integral membrane protein
MEQQKTIDIGQDLVIEHVLSKFSVSLLMMVAGMVVGALFIPPQAAIWMPVLCLVMLIAAFFVRRRDNSTQAGATPAVSMTFVYAFAALEGVGLYPVMMYYTRTIGASLVGAALVSTFVLFLGLSIYARHTSRNYLGMGSVLFMGLIALLVLSIIGIFIGATALQLVIAAGGLIIFSGYVIYDIQVMRAGYFTEADVPWMVLSLFLDFINLLLSILRLFGIFGSDD